MSPELPQVRESYDVMSLPDCTCVHVYGEICADCQRAIQSMRERPYHEGGHVLVARRQVQEWQRLEDAAIEFWDCTHDGNCECSLPLGWAVVGLKLERDEIVQPDVEVRRHA